MNDLTLWNELTRREQRIMIKLFGGGVHDESKQPSVLCPPGTVLQAGERLSVQTGSGAVLIRDVQPAGKKRMTVSAWARGRKIEPGQRFE